MNEIQIRQRHLFYELDEISRNLDTASRRVSALAERTKGNYRSAAEESPNKKVELTLPPQAEPCFMYSELSNCRVQPKNVCGFKPCIIDFANCKVHYSGR